MWFLQAIGSTLLGIFLLFLIGVPLESLGGLSDLLAAVVAPLLSAMIGYGVGSKRPNWRSTGKFAWILPLGLWTWAIVYDGIAFGWKGASHYLGYRYEEGGTSFEFVLVTVPMAASCAYSLGVWISGRRKNQEGAAL